MLEFVLVVGGIEAGAWLLGKLFGSNGSRSSRTTSRSGEGSSYYIQWLASQRDSPEDPYTEALLESHRAFLETMNTFSTTKKTTGSSMPSSALLDDLIPRYTPPKFEPPRVGPIASVDGGVWEQATGRIHGLPPYGRIPEGSMVDSLGLVRHSLDGSVLGQVQGGQIVPPQW